MSIRLGGSRVVAAITAGVLGASTLVAAAGPSTASDAAADARQKPGPPIVALYVNPDEGDKWTGITAGKNARAVYNARPVRWFADGTLLLVGGRDDDIQTIVYDPATGKIIAHRSGHLPVYEAVAASGRPVGGLQAPARHHRKAGRKHS